MIRASYNFRWGTCIGSDTDAISLDAWPMHMPGLLFSHAYQPARRTLREPTLTRWLVCPSMRNTKRVEAPSFQYRRASEIGIEKVEINAEGRGI